MCTSRDVTQFDQLNERLSLHEEIVRQIADRIALVGRDFIYRFANAANAAFYGMTPNEMIGVHVRDLIGAERFEGRARARVRTLLRWRKRRIRVCASANIGRRYVCAHPDGPLSRPNRTGDRCASGAA